MGDDDFMGEAVRLAAASVREHGGGPFGCVIVEDGRILARGWNQVTARRDPTAHAEITAIREACRLRDRFQLDGCDVYSSCEPCPMCLGALHWARPRRVLYAATRVDAAAAGFDDALLYRELGLAPEARTLSCRRLPHPGAGEAFRLWATKADRVPY